MTRSKAIRKRHDAEDYLSKIGAIGKTRSDGLDVLYLILKMDSGEIPTQPGKVKINVDLLLRTIDKKGKR